MNAEKLLPCPFCGGKAEWNAGKHADGSPWRYIACEECEAMGPWQKNDPMEPSLSEAEAIATWNRRTPDIAFKKMERLTRALTDIAAPRDCGCSPVCQCNSQSSLEIEVDALRDIARVALTPQGEETPAPQAPAPSVDGRGQHPDQTSPMTVGPEAFFSHPEEEMVEAMVLSLRDPFPSESMTKSGGIDYWREIMSKARRAALAATEGPAK